MKFAQDIIDCVEDLRIKTTDCISDIQSGLIPEFIETNWSVTDYYIINDERYDDIRLDQSIIKVNNVKFKIDHGNKSSLMFRENAWEAVKKDMIHPFLFFINGYFLSYIVLLFSAKLLVNILTHN